MIGYYAASKAGHDRNEIYIIISEDGEYVYLADGRLRTVEHPKRKNRKHIQIIRQGVDEKLCQALKDKKPVDNETLKRAIKLYKMAK